MSIPYEPLLTFMRESAQEGGPEAWKHLSVCQTSRPRLVFRAQERLRDGRAGVVGGFIFHNHDGDLKKGYYSVHT